MRLKASIPLILIGLYGIFIAIWAYISPLYNDELSALSRINYSSFPLFLEKGILMDAHPPLMQLLISFLDTIGLSPNWMKVLISLMGTGSLYLIYRIGRIQGLPAQNALIAPALLASTQFFLTYAIQIRPYQPGMFFVLLQVFAIVQLSSDLTKYKLWARTLIFATVFSCYTHYLSGLTSILLLIAAFMLLPKDHRVLIYKPLFFIGVLLGPLFPFFIIQIKHKGLAWLNAPEPTFPLEFFNYLGGYTWTGIIIFTGLIGLAIWRFKGKFHKESMYFLAVCVASYLVAHIYSVSRSPILQFSGLYFTLPLILLALQRNCLGPLANSLTAATIFITGLFITTTERQHFDIYQQQAVQQASIWLNELSEENPTIFSQLNPKYIKTTQDLQNLDQLPLFDFYSNYSGLKKFSELIEKSASDKILLLNGDLQKHDYLISQGFELIEFRSWLSADGRLYQKRQMNPDLSNCLEQNKEFAGTTELSLNNLISNRHEELQFSCLVNHADQDLKLVVSITKEDESIAYFTSKLLETEGPQLLQVSTRTISSIPFKADLEDYQVKYYLMNPNKRFYKQCSPINMTSLPGNNIRFALFERFLNP